MFWRIFWFIKSDIINVIIAIWLRIVCTIYIVIQSLDNNWYLSVVKEIVLKLSILSILNLSHTILVIIQTSLKDVKPKEKCKSAQTNSGPYPFKNLNFQSGVDCIFILYFMGLKFYFLFDHKLWRIILF